MAPRVSIEQGKYRLKTISFGQRSVPVLCQNEGGPCPLLAICNVLLLRGSIEIHNDYSEISVGQLQQLLAAHLLDVCTDPTFQQQVSKVATKYLMQACMIGKHSDQVCSMCHARDYPFNMDSS
jgi:ubiquitin carboxyl-terminal hydrolase MINDY-1/2